MTINKTQDGANFNLYVEGRLDTTTAPELEEEINSISGEANSIVLDIEKLEYISSAGLRVLLTTEKTMSKKGGFTIKNANETIMDVFEITGFIDILNIEK